MNPGGEFPDRSVSRTFSTGEEMAPILAAAPSVSTAGCAHEEWRVPSRWLLERTCQRQAQLLELFRSRQTDDNERAFTEKLEKDLAIGHRDLESFPPLPEGSQSIFLGLSPTIDFSPEDQVVTLAGNPTLGFVQQELAKHGQCLPLNPGTKAMLPLTHEFQRINDLIDFNLPHALSAQCGSWRDWTLGMTVVLADGTVAKSGSHAVKSVAGYDVHKLMIGARGTLAIISQVILRTFPLSALPQPDVEVRHDWTTLRDCWPQIETAHWVQRTGPADFATAVRLAGDSLLEADWASATLVAAVPADRELERFAGDWVLRSRCGVKNLEFTDPTEIRLMKRAKELFDPTHKLNSGELGIF